MELYGDCVLPRELVDSLYDFSKNDLNNIKYIKTTIDNPPENIDEKVWSAIIVNPLN